VKVLITLDYSAGSPLNHEWLKTLLNGLTFHCRLAVATALVLEPELEGVELNIELLSLLQESQDRLSPNYFTTMIKAAKYVKDRAEADRRLQLPLFQALPEKQAMIYLENGKEFGVEWLQGLFDKAIAELSNLLRRLYKGKVWQPVVMSWTTDGQGRRVLSSDLPAIAYLCECWNLRGATVEIAKQFANLVAEEERLTQ
jgi:hypothetical protein